MLEIVRREADRTSVGRQGFSRVRTMHFLGVQASISCSGV
eukprot:SAG25_NODE_568_length_6882_cov_518.788589_5_plen_40_part_00